jgi:hypothetical protein
LLDLGLKYDSQDSIYFNKVIGRVPHCPIIYLLWKKQLLNTEIPLKDTGLIFAVIMVLNMEIL